MSICRTESGLRVYIKPEEVWRFFMQNRAKLEKEMCLIAENEQTNYDLRLDAEDGEPVLRVFYNGEPEYGQYLPNRSDTVSIVRGLILSRLCPVLEESDIPDTQTDSDIPDEDDEEFSRICQAMIDMREEHLYYAACDFIDALLNGAPDDLYDGNAVDAVLDAACKILARRFKISIFRPTWVQAKDGGPEMYEEYPYLFPDGATVIAGEPSSYQEAVEYAEEQLDEGYYDDEEDQQRDDFPVT